MKTKTLFVAAAFAETLLATTSCSFFDGGKNRE